MCKSLKKAPRPSAGLMILRDERILILKRAKRSRNGGTWGCQAVDWMSTNPCMAVPTGNQWRKCKAFPNTESLDKLPSIAHAGPMRSLRVGPEKTSQKLGPALNHEHVDWRWVDFAWVRSHRHKLHPVLQNLISEKGTQVATSSSKDI